MPDDTISAVLLKLGELTGSNQAMVNQVSQLNTELGSLRTAINTELVNLRRDLDTKHRENVDLIAKRHEENLALLQAHKEDDAKNFKDVKDWQANLTRWGKVFAYIWTAITTAGIVGFVFYRWVVPFLGSIKGLGD